MTAVDDDWVAAAMDDDAVMAEFLLGLRYSSLKPDIVPLDWSVRQRRSKPASVNCLKKPAQRDSPTTPLSWSAATSHSGGSAAAVSEDSSLPKLVRKTGSEVDGECQKTATKRSRKKKNLAELKEEESSLITERLELKRQISALRVHLEKERDTNDSLKRMKLESTLRGKALPSAIKDAVSFQLEQTTTPSLITTASDVFDRTVPQRSSLSKAEEKAQHTTSVSKFILPDLNIAFDESQSSRAIS